MPAVKVTGATHEVGVDQLFFSTTDARGVIRHSNSVFIELSRYRRDELSGVPHNIIRHPEMPGGAFKAMWDTLHTGSPFAAYVRNLAADGSEYDVFATVTPLADGGYLSVRTRPVCTDLFSTACDIYRDARAVEDAALAQGRNRREASQEGLGRIAEMLAQAGLSSYEEFQNAALPAEVARREELSEGLPQRPGAIGELRTMLEAVTAIIGGLDSWMARQEELAALSASLKAAGKGLTETLQDPRLSAERIAALDRSDPRVAPLAELLDLWGQMQGIVSPLVTRLVDVLAQLDANSARTCFRIALARLHATITALFTVELIDGVGDLQYSAEAIPDLIETLVQGLAEMERQAHAHRALADQALSCIGEASRMMTIPHQLLMLWTGSPSAGDPALPGPAAELSGAASGVVESVGQRLTELDEAAARCGAVEVVTGASHMRQDLERLTAAAALIAPH
ncbi:PAS domain-containing protein [Actinomyces bowdenii]|uniref:PAS domain-containing protein n=1 Tax=Actinomyces bowdenii TaxID=131109 RepID=UPI00214BA930|nr:PAS domain-containing protein [Actinomyces bowdenii]MCR2052887.1 PAS domain-containing protein [Actinomyces bowdenii]